LINIACTRVASAPPNQTSSGAFISNLRQRRRHSDASPASIPSVARRRKHFRRIVKLVRVNANVFPSALIETAPLYPSISFFGTAPSFGAIS